MVSIEWLTHWFESNKAMLAELRIAFSVLVKDTKTVKPAQVYDIDTQKYVARVSLWESGECDFEAIEIGYNGVNVFHHRTIHSEEELDDFLMPLVSVL